MIIESGNDFILRVTLEDKNGESFELNDSVEVLVFTNSRADGIKFTSSDIGLKDGSYCIIITSDKLSQLDSGVVAYAVSFTNEIRKTLTYYTNFYLRSEVGKPRVDNLEAYYTKEEIDGLLASVSTGGSVDLSQYAKRTEITNKANKSDIPTKTSQLTNDSGFVTSKEVYGKTESDNRYQTKGSYLTSHQDLSDYAKKSDIPDTSGFATKEELNLASGGSSVDLSGYAKTSDMPTKISDLVNDSDFLTQHQDISGKADKTELKNYRPYQFTKTDDVVTKVESNLDVGKDNTIFRNRIVETSDASQLQLKKIEVVDGKEVDKHRVLMGERSNIGAVEVSKLSDSGKQCNYSTIYTKDNNAFCGAVQYHSDGSYDEYSKCQLYSTKNAGNIGAIVQYKDGDNIIFKDVGLYVPKSNSATEGKPILEVCDQVADANNAIISSNTVNVASTYLKITKREVGETSEKQVFRLEHNKIESAEKGSVIWESDIATTDDIQQIINELWQN